MKKMMKNVLVNKKKIVPFILNLVWLPKSNKRFQSRPALRNLVIRDFYLVKQPVNKVIDYRVFSI